MKKLIAGAVLAVGITFASISPANAVWYGPPTSGDHVHYYNCQGPYFGGYGTLPIYRCWADYDSFAEWFRGEVDRWVYVRGYSYSNA